MALTSSKSRCSIASTRQSWARAKAMRVSVMLVSSGDLDLVQDVLQACQDDELLLVAAARPAAVHPQQVAVDGRHGQALGGVGVALGVVQDLLVAPAAGSLHPGAKPVHQHCLTGGGHLRKPLAQLIEAGDEAAVRLTETE